MRKKSNISYFIFLMSIIFLFVSITNMPLIASQDSESDGLKVLNETSFEVDKTLGQDSNPIISFKLKNTLDKKLSNISFEENDHATFPEIDELGVNKTAEINASIISEEKFDGSLDIKGYYFQDLGEQDDTYNLIINSDEDISQDHFNTIKGDQLVIENQDDMDYELNNLKEDNEVTTIHGGDNYTLNLEEEGLTEYELSSGDFSWHDFTVHVDPQEGWVNNPEYDSSIDLKVNMEYPETEVSTDFPVTSYNISFYKTTDGIFTVTNDGDEDAKDINISNDWITFDENNFDLSPGETKNVGYTIEPFKGEQAVTNDTGKTYNKDIKIEGNFPTVNQTLDIFVEKANIGSGENTTNESVGLVAWVEEFCGNNPDICQTEPEVVYRTINKSSVDVPYTPEQVKSLARSTIRMENNVDVLRSEYGEKFDTLNTTNSESFNNLQEQNEEISSKLDNIEGKYSDLRVIGISFGSFFAVLIIVLAIVFVVRKIKRQREMERRDSF